MIKRQKEIVISIKESKLKLNKHIMHLLQQIKNMGGDSLLIHSLQTLA